MIDTMGIPQHILKGIFIAINQLYEMEQKLKKGDDSANLKRNVNKIANAFDELGFVYEDPMGQSFNETRADLDATISGTGTNNLVVVEVVKPIIRYRSRDANEFSTVVQKGIVVVESQKENTP